MQACSGWRPYVDNRGVKRLRENECFLAVYVPAGTHRLRLRYLPQSFVVGRAITLLTLALVAAILAARHLTRVRPGRHQARRPVVGRRAVTRLTVTPRPPISRTVTSTRKS